MRVCIIGGGVMGTMIAYHMGLYSDTKRNIVLLEGEDSWCQLHNVEQCTPASWGWANGYGKPPLPYQQLNAQGTSAYGVVERDVGDIGVTWGGSTIVAGNPKAILGVKETTRQNIINGYGSRFIPPQVAADIEPALQPMCDAGGIQCAVRNDAECHVDPAVLIPALVRRCISLGVDMRLGHKVVAVQWKGRSWEIHCTNGAIVQADIVVVASGVNSSKVVSLAGGDASLVPIRPAYSAILFLNPIPHRKVAHGSILINNDVYLHERKDSIILGWAWESPRQPDATTLRHESESLFRRAQEYVPVLRRTTVRNVAVADRPMPLDGHTIVGMCPAKGPLYVIATHSGMSLAPILGRLIATEVLAGVRLPQLDPFRPRRVSKL